VGPHRLADHAPAVPSLPFEPVTVLHDTRTRHVPIESHRAAARPDTFPKGRVCPCGTVLSIYNSASECQPCQLSKRQARLGMFRDDHVSYRRMMEEP
jgi:hypothetical protein